MNDGNSWQLAGHLPHSHICGRKRRYSTTARIDPREQGIGQSTCVSVGGDPIEGTTFADLLPHYESDEETRVVVIFCEPGGHMEEELADRLSQRKSRIPIVAFMAGRFMDRMQGVRFGHAAAIVNGNHGSPARKIERLRAAGVSMAEKISAIPELVRRVLAEKN